MGHLRKVSDMRPNIVFILTDDLGWTDLACYGSTFYETPTLDRLARQGIKFTQAYAASPVCSPTRASILSGKYPARLGVTQWIGGRSQGRMLDVPYVDHLSHSELSLGKALGNEGYAVWHVGKWHLGEREHYPETHGFEVNVGGCGWGSPKQGYFSPFGIETLEDGPPGEYLTDRLTDEAIRLIRNRDDRPFFLNLWHYAVHNPMQAKEEYVEKYREKAKRLGLDNVEALEEGELFPCDHKRTMRIVRRRIQSHPIYAAMVEILDENVGRLLQALEDEGIADNTVVIFTSDNGGLSTAEGSPTCNAPLAEGKGWMHEGGLRVPLMVHWPGVTSPRECAVPVTSPDFYPTILEIAGVAQMPEQHVDGESFAAVMTGSGPHDRSRPLYWHYPHYSNQGGTPTSSVRVGPYKLIENLETGDAELFNLVEDIGETRNLSDDEGGRVREMLHLLRRWRDDVKARVPEPNPEYQAPA